MASEQQMMQLPVEEDQVELLPVELQAPTSRLSKKTAVSISLGSFAVVLLVGVVWFRTRCTHDYFNLQDTVELDATGRFQALAEKLKGVTSKSVADKVVHQALTSGSDKIVAKWEATKGHHAPAPIRKLPNSFIQDGPFDHKGRNQGTAQCIFNVLEAMTATIALGNEINGMARVCRPPRPAGGDLACQVDAGLMVAFLGLVATKLSLAASNCAETANVDAICSAGVNGIVFALGQLAATASLAVPTCAPKPPKLPTTKISELGDQTLNGLYTGRRLVIGQGAVGNGIQCGVDVSLVAEQLANMGLAINQAANSGNCKMRNIEAGTAAAPNRGLVRSLCAVDIGGAITYFGEAITFIQLAIANCQDYLAINALCGAAIAGVTTAAAAIAPYGSAIHAACRRNFLAKEATGDLRNFKDKIKSDLKANVTADWGDKPIKPAKKELLGIPINPTKEELLGTGRRLEGFDDLDNMDYYEKLTHVTDMLQTTVKSMQYVEDEETSETNLNKLVELAEPGLGGASVRGAWPHETCQ